MLSWLLRRREAAQPESPDGEADAHSQASENKHRENGAAGRKNWARAALAAAQATSQRLGRGSAIRKAREEIETVAEGAFRAPRDPSPELYRLDDLVRTISAATGPEHYRVLLVRGGTARHPDVLSEVGIYAADEPSAIRQAFHIAWPPEAIGIVLIDHQGREVFGRDNAERTMRQRR